MLNFYNLVKNKLKVFLKKKTINSPERIYFENIIIPVLGLNKVENVLFIGVGPYNWHYQSLFNLQGINYFTVDFREEASIWGAKGRHKCINILDDEFNPFPSVKFNIIILIGVIGYGINNQNDLIKTLNNFNKLFTNEESRLLIACEDKFKLIPSDIIIQNNIKFKLVNSFGFNSIIEIPHFDYKFYFFKKLK